MHLINQLFSSQDIKLLSAASWKKAPCALGVWKSVCTLCVHVAMCCVLFWALAHDRQKSWPSWGTWLSQLDWVGCGGYDGLVFSSLRIFHSLL